MNFSSDEIKVLIPIVGTLVGVTLGWLLNELRDRFKINRENRRTINSILFNLLEIRFLLTRTQLDNFVPSLIKFLEKSFPNENIQEIQQIINQIFNIFLQSELSQKFGKDIKSIETKYNESITDLSKIDPILAYGISGKTQLYNYLEYLEDYTSKVDEIFQLEISGKDEPFDFQSLKEVLGNSMQPILYDEALGTVTKDIIEVSKKIGFRCFWSTKKVLKRQDSFDLAGELEKSLEGHMKVITTPLNKTMSNKR